MRWMTSFETGLKCMDEQHQHFFELMAELDRMAEKNQVSGIVPAIELLDRYLSYHFATEADLMAVYDYPDRDQHIAEHERFRRLVWELARGDELQIGTLRLMLYRWFTTHSTDLDRALAEHVLRGRRASRKSGELEAA